MITVETASVDELKIVVYENEHAGLLFKAAALTELMRRGEDHAETELEGLFGTGDQHSRKSARGMESQNRGAEG